MMEWNAPKISSPNAKPSDKIAMEETPPRRYPNSKNAVHCFKKQSNDGPSGPGSTVEKVAWGPMLFFITGSSAGLILFRSTYIAPSTHSSLTWYAKNASCTNEFSAFSFQQHADGNIETSTLHQATAGYDKLYAPLNLQDSTPQL